MEEVDRHSLLCWRILELWRRRRNCKAGWVSGCAALNQGTELDSELGGSVFMSAFLVGKGGRGDTPLVWVSPHRSHLPEAHVGATNGASSKTQRQTSGACRAGAQNLCCSMTSSAGNHQEPKVSVLMASDPSARARVQRGPVEQGLLNKKLKFPFFRTVTTNNLFYRKMATY